MSDHSHSLVPQRLKPRGLALTDFFTLPALRLSAPVSMSRAAKALFAHPWKFSKSGGSYLLTDPAYRDRISFAKDAASASLSHREDRAELVRELVEDADWVSLAELMQEWDQNRVKCPSGYPMIHLAVETFLATVTGESPDEFNGTTIAKSPISTRLITRLETLAAAKPDHYPLAALAAHLHLRKAWDLHGSGYSETVPEIARAGVKSHNGKASWLLEIYDPKKLNSPLLAALRFRLCDYMDPDDASTRLRQDYDTWRALDPGDMTAHEEYAFKMLPRWYGTYQELDIALRKSMATAGTKAYAAGYLAVALRDDGALATMDAELFAEGLDALIRFRSRDCADVAQMVQTVYEMSEMCRIRANTRRLPPAIKRGFETSCGILRAANRATVRNHLTGLCANAWDDGLTGALKYISVLFQEDLKAGLFLRITDAGMRIEDPTLWHSAKAA